MNRKIEKSGILDTDGGFSRWLRYYTKGGKTILYAKILGIGRDTMYSWRNGRRVPVRWVQMAVISAMLRVSVEELLKVEEKA